MEVLEQKVTGYKSATDAAIAEFKEQLRVSGATKGAIEAMEASFNDKLKDQDTKMAELNAYLDELKKKGDAKQLSENEQKSFNDLLADAMKENWSEIQKFEKYEKGHRFPMELKAPGNMTLTANVTGGTTTFNTVLPGIRTLPNRKVHMRQIIPLGSMTKSTLTYMREVGGEGNPAPWAVGDTTAEKPQVDRDFQEVTVNAEYIAAIMRISRKMLEDFDALRSYLQMRLMEMYLRVEDAQILNGNGTTPNLQGLMTVATAAQVTTGANVERLVWAIAQVNAQEWSADGAIMHPTAYYSIILNKAAGSGEYDLPGITVVQNGQLYIAGVPVWQTTAMSYNQYLVGDFALGAQLYIREQPVIEFFNEDRDNVVRNLVTIRIEGRAALAIYRPEAFVKGTFDGIPQFAT